MHPTTRALALAGAFFATIQGVVGASCSFWMEDIGHRGVGAFNGQSDYLVWRNVKDFGAKGDGVTDDTAAIQAAISANNTFASSTVYISTDTPSTVYFPPGTYVINTSLILHYATHMIGNPNCMPTIKASSSFLSSTVSRNYMLDTDYQNHWSYVILFYRQVRNIVFDTTAASPSLNLTAIYWPASQATTLHNLVFNMPKGSSHTGVYMPGGSGGYMGDLVFNGGDVGMSLGNQQYTIRNVTLNDVNEAIQQTWNWGFTYIGLKINNCKVGIRTTNVTQVSSIVLIDSHFSNTPVGIHTQYQSSISTAAGLVIENVEFTNVTTIVQDGGGKTLLAGSSSAKSVAGWAIGHTYRPNSSANLTGNSIQPNNRPASLVDSSGAYYVQSKPLYENTPATSFLSVRVAGAVGDGVHDDTAAVQHAIDTALARGQIVYFDAGVYRVNQTVRVPPGSKIVGEAFATIMSYGDFFNDYANPKPIVQVGQTSGQAGTVWWSDMLIQVQGPQAGAKLIEWNLASPAGARSGMWDVHGRTGGSAGTDLRAAECPRLMGTQVTASNYSADCLAAYMQMHVTAGAAGLYMENVWFWGGDKDLDGPYTTNPSAQIYTARGLLVQSTTGPIWMLAPGFEHNALYNFQFIGTKNIFGSQLQSETPYYSPNPPAYIPFSAVDSIFDPHIPTNNATYTSPTTGVHMPNSTTWGFRAVNSSDVLVYGAGHYAFWLDWKWGCGDTGICQSRLVSLENSEVWYYDLHTVGSDIMVTNNGKDIASIHTNLIASGNNIAEIAVFRPAQ